MINLVSLLTAAALVSLQCGFLANAQLDSSNLDNDLQANVIPTPKRQIRKYVHIFLAPPETVQHVPGQQTVLECQVYGSPAPSVSWLKNGQPFNDLEEDSNEIIAPHPSSIASLTSKLVVSLPSNGDVYTCVATSGVNRQTASTTVYTAEEEESELTTLEKLLRMSSKPLITAANNEVLQESGSNVLLPCRVFSYSKTQVEWFDSHLKPVHGNPRFRVLPSGDLLIMGLRWSDMGNFTCTAMNVYGKDVAKTFVYPVKP